MANIDDEVQRLTEALEDIRNKTGVPGLSVYASVGGRAISSQVGVSSVETMTALSDTSMFEVSCLMKLFVSTIAYREYMSGSFDIDMPIVEALPELRKSHPLVHKISVSHLMSHSSGLKGLDIANAKTKWAYSWQQLIDHINDQDPAFPAGTTFNYEHSEHVILGEILSRHYGKDIEQIVAEKIFTPLGIKVSNANADRKSGIGYVSPHVYASSSQRYVASSSPAFSKFWRASLPDMTIKLSDVLRVGEAMLTDKGNALRIGMTTTAVSLPSQVAANESHERLPLSFGRICAQYPSDLVGHNGSVLGQTVAIRIDVSQGIVIVIGVNSWVPRARDEAIVAVHRIMRQLPYEPSESVATAAPFNIEKLTGSFLLDELAGSYEGSLYSRLEVSLSDDDIKISVGGARAIVPIAIRRRSDGLYEMDTTAPISCAFIRHPLDASPVCQMGVHAYRRVKSRSQQ